MFGRLGGLGGRESEEDQRKVRITRGRQARARARALDNRYGAEDVIELGSDDTESEGEWESLEEEVETGGFERRSNGSEVCMSSGSTSGRAAASTPVAREARRDSLGRAAKAPPSAATSRVQKRKLSIESDLVRVAPD